MLKRVLNGGKEEQLKGGDISRDGVRKIREASEGRATRGRSGRRGMKSSL